MGKIYFAPANECDVGIRLNYGWRTTANLRKAKTKRHKKKKSDEEKIIDREKKADVS